jgi:hypothetical protein
MLNYTVFITDTRLATAGRPYEQMTGFGHSSAGRPYTA